MEEGLTQINSSIDSILSQWTQYYSLFIGCALVRNFIALLSFPHYTPRYIVYGGYIGVTLDDRFVGLWTFLVNTIFQKSLVRIPYNFTRMIDTKPSCAYWQKEKLLVLSNFGICHNVFKNPLLQMRL